jgi:hypothetical protein
MNINQIDDKAATFAKDCAYLHWLEYRNLVLERHKTLLEDYNSASGKRPTRKVYTEMKSEIATLNRKTIRIKGLISKIRSKAYTANLAFIPNEIETQAMRELNNQLENMDFIDRMLHKRP